MTSYADMTTQELESMRTELYEAYEAAKAKGLKLNMARGKPSPAQLDLSLQLLDEVNSHSQLEAADGTDCRNYGVLGGIPEARELMGEMLGAPAANVIVGGNASLAMMYDAIARAYTHGVLGETPWCKLDKVRWLCPAPGYDRHFTITEHFGFEMIPVPLTGEGPDMDFVESHVNSDPSVKGMWCVPTYANPTGESYSDDVVRRIAALRPAATDFRVFWDNAYAVHHLYEEPERQDHVLEILSACEEAGNPNMVYEFASTSKITFPGAGISCMAASEENIKDTLALLGAHTIGYDKLNQLRHVRFLRDAKGVANHMAKHAALLRPKFELIERVFAEEFDGTGIGEWTHPRGGYFVTFYTMPGCAKEVVAKAADAGLSLTKAGAMWPYGNDPQDCGIRIAPSYPTRDELEDCMRLFVLCVKLVSIEHILASTSASS